VSNRGKSTFFTIGCLVLNILVWLPGCYLSLVAWITKFSGNSILETAVARVAFITPILGVILAVVSNLKYRDYYDSPKPVPFKIMIAGSLLCAAPIPVYVALKLI